MTAPMEGPPRAYCFAYFGLRMGPWRASWAEAREDALDAGHAERDDVSATIYLDAGAEIWASHAAVTTEPRPPAAPRIVVPYPTRIERIIARRAGEEAA